MECATLLTLQGRYGLSYSAHTTGEIWTELPGSHYRVDMDRTTGSHYRVDTNYKLPIEAHFVCDEAFATVAVLRPETKEVFCF